MGRSEWGHWKEREMGMIMVGDLRDGEEGKGVESGWEGGGVVDVENEPDGGEASQGPGAGEAS